MHLFLQSDDKIFKEKRTYINIIYNIYTIAHYIIQLIIYLRLRIASIKTNYLFDRVLIFYRHDVTTFYLQVYFTYIQQSEQASRFNVVTGI